MQPTRKGGISQKSVGNVITRPCTVQSNPGTITTQPLANTNIGKTTLYNDTYSYFARDRDSEVCMYVGVLREYKWFSFSLSKYLVSECKHMSNQQKWKSCRKTANHMLKHPIKSV